MNNFLTNKKLIGILVSVIFVTALIAFSLNDSGNTNIVQRTVNDVTSFVSRIVTKPVEATYNVFESVDTLQDTFQENKRLKREVEDVYALQARVNTLESEKEALEQELNLKNSLSDFTTSNATVISRSPDNWAEQLTIDSGSNDGIELNMPVLSQNGLIGRISEVGLTSSKVTLITTPDQRDNLVSAEVITDDDEIVHGVIESYDESSQRLVMNQVTSDIELQEGQQVITSGLSGKTPRSLIIGIVDEVSLGDFGLTQRVYIEPAVDFDEIHYVTIVKRSVEGEASAQ